MPTSEERTTSSPKGSLTSQISREIVQLHARLYGRGPTKARSYVHEDWVVCILEDILTVAERTLIDAGSAEHVHDTRRKFQEAVRDQFVEIIERITGRTVGVFMSQVEVVSGMSLEFFILEPRNASPDGQTPPSQDGADPTRQD